MTYIPSPSRYSGTMRYRRSGKSGVLLPEISLGLWHNFGAGSSESETRAILHYAFDHGITHFDLANNYGPPAGSAEETLGRLLRESLAPYRDELFISTKAGHDMWPGPYGSWGSRKHLFASLDQSLRRLGLDYVDVFYSHRYDPSTPVEETLEALSDLVRQGKALYVGLSKWPAGELPAACRFLAERHTPCLLYQGRRNLLDAHLEEEGVLDELRRRQLGFVAFSPLAQGLLTDRYLHGIPAGSRMAQGGFLRPEALTPQVEARIRALRALARQRGESLARMALAWLLADPQTTSVIVGASSTAQLAENLKALESPAFSPGELAEIASAGHAG